VGRESCMCRVLVLKTPTCAGVRLQPIVSSCVVNTPKCTSLVHKRPTYIGLFCKEAWFFGKETSRSLAKRPTRVWGPFAIWSVWLRCECAQTKVSFVQDTYIIGLFLQKRHKTLWSLHILQENMCNRDSFVKETRMRPD